ncbi:accessory Sec system S-layer assembly protein, partial [Oceanobacillus massiliensis]|uniref:accessory Sec system S-layer assembly protein n=1 Tax=Oceanobacillus massiliensis TaxID=1465765 RepID=UPI0030170588
MFGFSKRSKQKPVSDQIINNDDIPENNSTISDDNETETFLSIPPDWKLSNEDRYIYAFYNHQSPKLRINQVSIYGMEMKKVRDNKLEVTGLIRNTVQKNIQFKETSILLLGNQNEIIARDTFNLKLMGKIPPNGARPWNFAFSLSEEETHDIEMMQGTWSLAFEMKREHKLELDKSWEETIAKELKSNLERITANAAPLKPGEVNIMGLKAELNEKKELVVTLLIRNGSNKKIT